MNNWPVIVLIFIFLTKDAPMGHKLIGKITPSWLTRKQNLFCNNQYDACSYLLDTAHDNSSPLKLISNALSSCKPVECASTDLFPALSAVFDIGLQMKSLIAHIGPLKKQIILTM